MIRLEEFPSDHVRAVPLLPPIGQAVAPCAPLVDDPDLYEVQEELADLYDVADCCFCQCEIWVEPALLGRFLISHPSMHLACNECYRRMYAVFN